MAENRTWIIVDDQLSEAETFAATFRRISDGSRFAWQVMPASKAQNLLFASTNTSTPGAFSSPIAGVFADVDLSGDGKLVGTGLGLAQNLRAEQKKKTIPDYPLFRFANPDPVREYVGDDPASDDLFDLLVSKDAGRNDPHTVVREALGARIIYDDLACAPPTDLASFSKFVGLAPEHYELWGDSRLWLKVRIGLSSSSSTHVAAGSFLKSFIGPEGLLLSEKTLAVRLGIDIAKSSGWPELLKKLDQIKYRGAGSDHFPRWWARGLDAFWLEMDSEEYLYQRRSEERVEMLRKALGFNLTPLMPSAPYWRLCALSLEQKELRPIVPELAVTLIQSTTKEPWLDPEQAASDIAAMKRDDPRVNPEELTRLLK